MNLGGYSKYGWFLGKNYIYRCLYAGWGGRTGVRGSFGCGGRWGGQKRGSRNGENMVVSHRLLVHVRSCTTWWGGQLGGAPATTSSGDHSGGLSHWFATYTDQWQILPPYAAQPPDGGYGWSGRGPRRNLHTPMMVEQVSYTQALWC